MQELIFYQKHCLQFLMLKACSSHAENGRRCSKWTSDDTELLLCPHWPQYVLVVIEHLLQGSCELSMQRIYLLLCGVVALLHCSNMQDRSNLGSFSHTPEDMMCM